MKPQSKVIQLVKHSQDEVGMVTSEFLALCEDGSIWLYYPTLLPKERWELLSEMEGEKYIC